MQISKAAGRCHRICSVLLRIASIMCDTEAQNDSIAEASGDAAETLSPDTVDAKQDKQKVDILLKAAGNAPIMKKKKWAVDQDKKIGWIIEFIKKYLKLDSSENLFLYVNQTFAPSPDQIVRNLYECFGSDGKLVLHYCRSQAWG
ncbi:hypothetical protein B566_EDAN014006 [Ephemera danica]|nr:hypothetical protein B566_EDAN014006 [Ephemera danica]